MLTRDAFGDPRDYLAEVQEMMAGQLPLSPTRAHCQALLRAVLTRQETTHD